MEVAEISELGLLVYVIRLEYDAKKRHLSDSNTRGQSPTAVLIAGDPVNHSGKVT